MDPLTETYDTRFYFHYLAKWPEYFNVAVHPTSNKIMGYIMGKSEGRKEQWHGHVTAVTVSPSCRRLGLANQLMADLERISDERDCRFVDLFVRQSNTQAYSFYEKLGYFIHERIPDYYQALDDPNVTEDAYDMHKNLTGYKLRKRELEAEEEEKRKIKTRIRLLEEKEKKEAKLARKEEYKNAAGDGENSGGSKKKKKPKKKKK